MKTPKLLDCTQESVLQCMLNCSALGLEPDGRRAHLIPYGTTCTLIVDYKGIVELAKRSGDVANVFAQIVCENDNFSWENGEVKHQVDFRKARGNMYAAYAIITFKDGTKQTDVMTKDEIDSIRKRSKASNSGPWVTDYNEMAKKTVFRRASKWITLSPEVADAFEKDDGSQLAVGLPEIQVPSKPEHALVDVVATKTPDDGDLGPEKPKPADEKPATATSVIPLKQPAPAPSPTSPPAPAPSTPPDATKEVISDSEVAKLVGMVMEKANRDGVTEQQVVTYCRKNKLSSAKCEKLADMVPAKLALVVENWDRVIEKIKAS
jgi:recombinational DNA repair protein RecT